VGLELRVERQVHAFVGGQSSEADPVDLVLLAIVGHEDVADHGGAVGVIGGDLGVVPPGMVDGVRLLPGDVEVVGVNVGGVVPEVTPPVVIDLDQQPSSMKS
jgi:hypothetical protein